MWYRDQYDRLVGARSEAVVWYRDHYDRLVGARSEAVVWYREQCDRLIEGSRLLHSRLRVQLRTRATRF